MKLTNDLYHHYNGEQLRKSGKIVLVVGYSNTVPDLLNQLSGTRNYQSNDGDGICGC